jgi:hypothetical protein
VREALVEDLDRLAQNLVRVALAVENAVDRLECPL